MKSVQRDILIVSLIVAFLFVLIALAQTVAADTTIGPYTSTADFDSGTKTDSSGDHFQDNGADSPFYGFTNVPSAQYHGGRTYVAYQGGVNNAPYVTYYDHATNTWATPVMAYTLNTLNQDGHGGPVILVQSTGRIHIFYSAHDSDMEYARSRSVSDITSWETMVDLSGTLTYPHAFETSNNTIYLFMRCSGLNDGDWCWRFSTDTGATWSTATTKIDFATATPYIGHGKLYGGKYVFAFVNHNDDGDLKRKNVYACRIDMATGNIESISGTNLGLVLNDAEAAASCRIEDTGADETWYAAMDVDTAGFPYVIYSKGIGTNVQQRWSYWTGAAWASPVNIVATDELASYSALIVTSSTNVDAFLTTAGSASVYNGDMEHWRWNGATWSRSSILKTEATSGLPVGFPVAPLNYNDEVKVVFAEWGVNTDTNALFPHAKIYGWGADGFVTNPAPTRYVETITNNPNVVFGNVQLESVSADTFGIADGDGDTFKWDPIAGIGCTNGVLAATVTRSIAAGVLSVSDTSGTNACRAGVRLSVSLSGDWDIRIQQNRGAAGVGRLWEMHVINDPRVSYCADSALADGILYQIPAEGAVINAFTCINGAFAQVGSNTAEPGDPQYYRLTRASNTFTWYYSSDGVIWIQDEQTTSASIANPVYFLLTVNAGTPSGTVTAADYDDFRISSGIVAQGGYRRSGSWTSPTTSLTAQRVQRVSLEYSSLSATAYIDQIDILDDSVVVWSSTANIVSGISTNLFPAQDVSGMIAVRVTLASSGSSTPVLGSVEYSVVPQSSIATTFSQLDLTWVIGLILWLALTIMGFTFRQPAMLIFAGILGFFLAFTILALTGSLPIALILMGASIMLIVLAAASGVQDAGGA